MAEVQARLFGEHGRHLRGDRPRPARAAGHDRGDAADARRRDRVVPGADAVPGATSPTSRAGCSPAPPSCARALPPINGALRAGVPAFRQTPELSDDLEKLFAALDDLSENPNTLLALQRPPPRRRRSPSRRSSTSRPTRRSATTPSTSSTRSARTSRSRCPAARPSASSPSSPTSTQPNTLGSDRVARPVDVPADQDPQAGADSQAPAHASTRSPAARRRRGGRTARRARPATWTGWSPTGATRRRSRPDFSGGGSHVVVDGNTPGLRRRHLQVPQARHRQPEGRALMQRVQGRRARARALIVVARRTSRSPSATRSPTPTSSTRSCATPRT